ncbi:ORF61 [Leucania separata nucleopolyhedrovirus]|uniref:ORF61 n=1 Tax=Leucania separata nucleopolyhedrovirus TaxID=1307956 RepID=Q0IL58_NPVLS|nr:ORF61 [Leucania separata nucleopolyhedrovirus]AAR28825.1 ORF61 [Leucania separata nucleopolyhedrovirus]
MTDRSRFSSLFSRRGRRDRSSSRDDLSDNNESMQIDEYPDYEKAPFDGNEDANEVGEGYGVVPANEPIEGAAFAEPVVPPQNPLIRLHNLPPTPIEISDEEDGRRPAEAPAQENVQPTPQPVPPPTQTYDVDETDLGKIIELEGRLGVRPTRRLSKSKANVKATNGFEFDTKTPSEIYFNNDPMTIRVVPPLLQYIPNRPNNVFYVQKAIDNLKYYLQNIIDYNEMNLLTFFISYDVGQEHKVYFETIINNILEFNPNRDNLDRAINLFEYYYNSFINVFDILLYVVVNVNYSTDEPNAITYSLMNFINGCAQFIENKIVKRLELHKVTRSRTNPIDEATKYRIKDIQSDLTNLYNAKLIALMQNRFYKYTGNNLDVTFELPRQPKDPSQQILELRYQVEVINTDLYI